MVHMTTDKYKTIRIWPETVKALRLLAALSDERMVQVLDRLVRAELERMNHVPNHVPKQEKRPAADED